MNKDLIPLFIACIHHKDVENKEDLLKEIFRVGITNDILVSVNVIFKQKDMTYLRELIINWNPPQTILYVGGTTRNDPAKREEEHERTKFPQMISFYYCPVEDVKSEETELLQRGGNKLKKNVHKKSNCKAEQGFVYVLDTGLVS